MFSGTKKEHDDAKRDAPEGEKKKSIVTPNDVGAKLCSMKDKSRMLDALTKRYVLSMNEEDISIDKERTRSNRRRRRLC